MIDVKANIVDIRMLFAQQVTQLSKRNDQAELAGLDIDAKDSIVARRRDIGCVIGCTWITRDRSQFGHPSIVDG